MSINQRSAEDVPDTVAEWIVAPEFIDFRAARGMSEHAWGQYTDHVRNFRAASRMNEHAWRLKVLEAVRRLGDTAFVVDESPVGANRLLAMQAMRRDVDYDEMPDVVSEDSDDELDLVSESEGG